MALKSINQWGGAGGPKQVRLPGLQEGLWYCRHQEAPEEEADLRRGLQVQRCHAAREEEVLQARGEARGGD